MAYKRGEIIDVSFVMPEGGVKNHPGIIISSEDVYNNDGCYICVMMTHMKQTDIFSFEIEPYMLVEESDGKFSQARLHLITYVSDGHILNRGVKNSLKPEYVEMIIDLIYRLTLEGKRLNE